MLGALKQNISFAIRTLFKNKGFTITAVLDARVGYWRDDGDLQRGLCGVRADAVSESGSARDGVGQDAERSKLCAGRRFSRMATTQHFVPGHECMDRRLIQRRN